MSASNYLENLVLDKMFGNTDFTPSGIYYVALSSGNPTDLGTSINEPNTVTGYQRVPHTNDKEYWSTAVSGQLHNMAVITFPQAVSDWGYIDYFALFDASGLGNGNLIGWGAVTTPKYVYNGDIPTFASGSLIVTLD